MRTWTLALSIAAHAAIVVAIFVAPIFAAADLPEPRRPFTFEVLTSIVTPVIPAPARPQLSKRAPSTPSFPVNEPPDLPPDMPSPIADVPPDIVAYGDTGVPSGVIGPVGDPVAAPPTPPPARRAPVPVGGVIRPPARVVYIQPVYPSLALAARKEGTVILQAIIDENGGVREVKVLRSIPLLDDAAVHAVSQWKFTPTTLNGTTVPVVMTVTVTFVLQK
jgi:protein TonB